MDKKIIQYILLFSIAGLVTVYCLGKIIDNNLKKNQMSTTAKVTAFHKISRGGGSIEYEYFVENKRMTDYKNYVNINQLLGGQLIGKYFPLFYNSHNARSNKILISSNDFQNFEIIFPDSLQWTTHIFK